MESRALKCFTMVLEQIIRQLVVLKDDKELGLAEGRCWVLRPTARGREELPALQASQRAPYKHLANNHA